MSRRLAALLIPVAFLLISCGGGDTEGAPEPVEVTVTGTIEAESTPTDEPATTPSSEPEPIFSDGTYRVGDDVQPGRYFVRTDGDGCSWEQTDANGDIIDSGSSNGRRIEISITASAYSFTSSDCGEWRLVD